ncbi:MAG: molybdenum cofactor biosynthesis protein MoaE [Sphingomicrobium sp.]
MTSIIARLQQADLDAAAEFDALMREAVGDGAIVTFVGVARATNKAGEAVDALVLEPHPKLTQLSLDQIAADGATKFDVSRVMVVHRFGSVLPGQPVVFVGTASPHRRAAFEAADYLMDRLKTEAMFWKREEGPAGSAWIEPTEADYRERGRWE